MDQVTTNTRAMYEEFPFGDWGALNDVRERNNAMLFELLSMYRDGQTLFDVGCGAGYWLDVYLRHGIPKDKIVGVDLAPRNVEQLRSKGFQVICGDAQSLDVEDRVSDVTVCLGVLHHTADPYRAFRELVRITKPGGYIYVAVYNGWNPYFYIVHKAMFPIRYCYWHWTKKVADVAYAVLRTIARFLARARRGKAFDDAIGRVLFMDQVMIPRAHLFTKNKLKGYAQRQACRVLRLAYSRDRFMVTAIMQVPDRNDGESGIGAMKL